MLFNSSDFIIFFTLAVILFLIIPKKLRQVYLLIVSYLYYMSWGPRYVLFILFSTVTTYGCGLALQAEEDRGPGKYGKHYSRLLLIITLLLNIGVLAYFKYSNFGSNILNAVFSVLHIGQRAPRLSLLAPVGISFYTLQAVGYLADVWRKKIPAERNMIRYGLFVSFFPQIVSGPISRASDLLHQISEIGNKKRMDLQRISGGLIQMLWGYFLKLVIADRVAVLVDNVFDFYYRYRTFALLAGAIGFAVQIYCDFAGYSTIALGAAKVLGFHLPDNFDAPYFAGSVTAFWRRWHISLSSWLRDYIYIPLGGNRKGKMRQSLNILITFLVSGLWHGAGWTFLVWGLLHGLYQILEKTLQPFALRINRKCGTRTDSVGYRIGRAFLTFVLVDFAWIFFRADSLHSAFAYIARLFTSFDPWSFFNGTIYTLGLNVQETNILFVSLLILFLADLVKRKKRMSVDVFLNTQWSGFRWAALLTLLFFVLVFGCYGPGFESAQFIYSQF